MLHNAKTGLRDRTFSRLQKSITGEPCDRHSVFFYYTFLFYQTVTGVNLDAYFHDPKVTFETQLEVIEKLERCGSFAPDEGAIAECSALGGEVRFDAHGLISVKEAPINDVDDVLKMTPGDPYGDNYMRKALESLEYMVQHAPEGIKVNPPVIHGPFTVAAQLRGINEFCMDVLLEPELCEALLDVCTETSINFMKAAEKILGGNLHHILLADDISAFLSREQYKQWVIPYYERIFKEFPGVQKWLHNDANAAHIAPEIAAFGWDAWQYAPSIDPINLLADTGEKVSLMGGLSPLTLQTMSAEETYAHCVEVLKRFNGNTKFVLGPGGSVNQIPVENLLAILRAADDFALC